MAPNGGRLTIAPRVCVQARRRIGGGGRRERRYDRTRWRGQVIRGAFEPHRTRRAGISNRVLIRARGAE